MQTNWLAGIFTWLRIVIEEADRPISLLVTVLLPFIAPLSPALITASNLNKYMNLGDYQSAIIAVTFEAIGYVAMIATVGAIMRWVDDERNQRSWLPVVVAGSSYACYIIALILINLILEIENGIPATNVAVTAFLTVGTTIPASLLNGTRISGREKNERDNALRQEKRQDGMARYKIRHGINPDAVYNQETIVAKEKKRKFASDYRNKIVTFMTEFYQKKNIVPRIVEISNKFGLDYNKSKGYISSLRKAWMEQNGIQEQ